MDKSVFENIYTEHYSYIRKYCYYHTYDIDLSDEITQATFEKAWLHIKSFEKHENVKAWLVLTARNFILMNAKKSKIIKFVNIEDSSENMNYFDKEFENVEIKDFIDSIYDDLSSVDKEIFKLFFVKQDSIKDISSNLKLTEGAVKMRIKRIKNKFKIKNVESYFSGS